MSSGLHVVKQHQHQKSSHHVVCQLTATELVRMFLCCNYFHRTQA